MLRRGEVKGKGKGMYCWIQRVGKWILGNACCEKINN